MVDLTISIVNHRHSDLLEPLLKSIRKHTRSVTYETYVVDNVPGDGSATLIMASLPWVKWICNDRPLGFAANHNQVMRQGKGRYVILLNDDMLLQNDALDRLVAFMDAHPQVGAAGCKLLNRDGTLQRSCWRGYPSARTLLIDLFYLSSWLPNLSAVRGFEATVQGSVRPVEVDYLLGACIIVRHEVVSEVGLLDESFFMFLEETDWCYRIRQRGWQIYWTPDGEIIHYGQQSVSRDPVRFVPMLYRNYCRFCRKHRAGGRDLVVIKAVIGLGMTPRIVLWAYRWLRGRPNSKQMLRGYLTALWAVPGY